MASSIDTKSKEILIYVTRSNLMVDNVKLKELLGVKNHHRLINSRLMLKYKSHIGNEKRFRLYQYVKHKGSTLLVMPKQIRNDVLTSKLLSSTSIVYKVIKVDTHKVNTFIEHKLVEQLYETQTIVIDYIMRNFFTEAKALEGRAGLNMIMKTGAGKTRLAIGLAHRLGLKTLIIEPTCYLVNQVIEKDARPMLGNSFPIGKYIAKEKTDGLIVVGGIHMLCKAESSFLNQFHFVVFDEVDAYCTPQYSSMFWNAQAPYTLGLTAKPDARIDGFDKAIVSHIGPIVIANDIPGYAIDDVKFSGHIDMLYYNGPDEYTKTILNEKTGIVSVPLMIKNIIEDPYRLQLIVNKIIGLNGVNRHIYVFSEHRKYLLTIQKRLNDMHVVSIIADDEPNVNVLMGGASDEDMANASIHKSKSVILTTYAFSKRGISIKHMDAIILATPRRNDFVQIVGRILRRGSDSSINRIVIDVVDNATVLKKQVGARKKSYNEIGFNVNNVETVEYQDIENVATADDVASAADDADASAADSLHQ